MPTRCRPFLLALLLLLAAPGAVSAQSVVSGAEAALTPAGLRLSLPCAAPLPSTVVVEVGGRPPVEVAPAAVPPAPLSLALLIERSPAMAEAGTPYSTRLADAAALAAALLERAPPGSQVSLLSFDDRAARMLVAPTADLRAARDGLAALASLPAGQAPPPEGLTAGGGRPAAALGRAEALLGAGPDGAREIVVFAAGGLAPGDLAAIGSGTGLTVVNLGGGEAAGGPAPGAGDVAALQFHTGDSAALPGLFAAYERRVAELAGGRASLVVPVAGLGPGRHEARVSGCGAPQVASFELPAPAPGPALLLAACALPALGLGYGLWRRRRAGGGPGRAHETARYRSPLDVTTARREAGQRGRAELCAVVWDGRERQVHRLEARQSTVGRDAGCAIRIESEWVSGLHARLSLVGEGVEIADLESTNGTFIGEAGRQLAPGAPAPLALGELVRFGPEVRLTVQLAEAAEADGLQGQGRAGAGGKL